MKLVITQHTYDSVYSLLDEFPDNWEITYPNRESCAFQLKTNDGGIIRFVTNYRFDTLKLFTFDVEVVFTGPFNQKKKAFLDKLKDIYKRRNVIDLVARFHGC
jgi:hypothetical protein